MGDAKSASRVADIRLRRDSAKDRGRERANRMIVILPVVMVSVLIATFLMWLLSTRTSATYLETPQVFSMTILLILWQLMTYAVVKRVAGDEKLDEQR
jgi:amino acid transporter